MLMVAVNTLIRGVNQLLNANERAYGKVGRSALSARRRVIASIIPEWGLPIGWKKRVFRGSNRGRHM